MNIAVINFEEKFGKFQELHSYKAIARMNDYLFKLIRVKREFIWHKHPETDEAFMVFDGTLTIELRDKVLLLKKGDMAVIPKGVEHKPSCTEECKVLIIEPAGTVNTGDSGGKLTDSGLEWI
jgi:mannose-6-phosphate isomerase-like protein (cupin superfamily)